MAAADLNDCFGDVWLVRRGLGFGESRSITDLRRPPFSTARDVDVAVVGRDPGTRRAGINVHRIKTLQRRDVLGYQQMPITSPARALLDIAAEVSGRSLEWA